MSSSECPYCKKALDDAGDFCPHCGWYLLQDPPVDNKAESDELAEARIFLVLSTHERWRIEKLVTTIGRDMGDIMISDDLELSRLHCEFVYKNHKMHVKDLQSHNGVFVGERQIPPDEEIPLQPGDRVKIGSNTFTIEFKSDLGTGEEMGPIFYLRAIEDKKDYQLRLGENLVGRGEYCHIRIDDAEFVGKKHALIELFEDVNELGRIKLQIQDTGTKNGTTVNGVSAPPHRWKEIDVGDEIGFANVAFELVSRPRE